MNEKIVTGPLMGVTNLISVHKETEQQRFSKIKSEQTSNQLRLIRKSQAVYVPGTGYFIVVFKKRLKRQQLSDIWDKKA